MSEMRVEDLLEKAHIEIKQSKERRVLELVKVKIRTVEDLRKALHTAETTLNKLLETKIEDIDLNVW